MAIVSPNSGRFLTSFFGVSGFGRILVPINFRLTADEIAYIVEHSGASVLLYDPDLVDEVDTIKVSHRFCLDGVDDAALFAPAPAGAVPQRWEADEDATCSVNYTSGTTARPKGVQLTHRNCWLNADHVRVAHRRQRPRRAPAHAADVPLQRLGDALCGDRHGRRPRRAAQGGRRGDPVARSSATASRSCAARPPWWRPSSARPRRAARGAARCPAGARVRIVVAGAPPPSKTIERVETELGWEFIQIYGLTETAPLLTINRAPGGVGRARRRPRARCCSAGPAFPPSACRSRSTPTARSWPVANHVFAGYWEQPTRPAEALDGGWFHTGDGGYLDGAYLVISDRKKDVIITGGENVSSIEVEDCLYQHAAVAEVAVIGVPDEKWGETIKALVVVREGDDGQRGRAHRALPRPAGPLQGADQRRVA